MCSTITRKSKIVDEMMKLSFHHRAFYCYLGMSLWIFFLITVMYKYMSVGEEPIARKVVQNEFISKSDSKFRRIYMRACNPADSIIRGSEGLVDTDAWLLQGVLVVTRHGDRGPLTHLRGGDKLPCDSIPVSPLLKSYEEYVHNASSSGRAWWVSGPGPFHNFPSLPPRAAGTHCALGQLTPRGLLQMITVGNILRDAYGEALGFDNLDAQGKKDTGSVILYSTRYRRTFQSLVGVAWGAWRNGATGVPGVTGATGANGATGAGAKAAAARELHSVAACFTDCACSHHHHLNKKINHQAKNRLESHPAIKDLVIKLSKVLFESQENPDPDLVRDALLAYICHDAPLPCTEKYKQKVTPNKGQKKYRTSSRKLVEDIRSSSRKLLNVDNRNKTQTLHKSRNEFRSRKLSEKDIRSPSRRLLNVDKQNETLTEVQRTFRSKKLSDEQIRFPPRKLLNEKIQSPPRKLSDEDIQFPPRKLSDEEILFPPRQLSDEEIRSPPRKLSEEEIRSPPRKLLDEDIRSPLKKLSDEEIRSSPRKLSDEEIQSPPRKLSDEEIQFPPRKLLDVDIDTLNMELEYINNQLDFNNEIGRKARDIIGKYYDSKNKPLDFDAQMEREKLLYYQQRYIDNAEAYDDVVIVKKNLDADFNFPNDARMDTNFEEDYNEPTQDTTDDFCVRKEHVMSLFAYLEWTYRQEIKNINNRRRGLLLAYGLIHNIVQNMIRMISENKPKFVLYSGHDKTLQPLILALGLNNYQHYNIQYASRMIFEVYRKKDLRDEFKFTKRKAVAQDFYFRIVYNGEDVTNKLSFCRKRQNVVMKVVHPIDDMKVYNTYLCSIENIVRFIHDDYFASFNASNFKDACSTYNGKEKQSY